MITRRTIARLYKRALQSKSWILAGGVVILFVMTTNFSNSPGISAAAYAPLLSTIAKGESGGNYNAYFGNSTNASILFTDMTVAEVLQWQDDHLDGGNVSNAVGKYQIIKPTLTELINIMSVDMNAKFDPALQDRMAITLIERRGSIDYATSKLSREQFAANLAKEWAALPKVIGQNAGESYYAADGINVSNITVDEMYSALDSFRESSKKE